MTEKIVFTLVFIVGFTLICWAFMEYQLRAPKHAAVAEWKGKAFCAVGRFCQTLQQKKNFRSLWMEKEFGDATLDELYTSGPVSETSKIVTGQEEGSKDQEKRFNMKINM